MAGAGRAELAQHAELERPLAGVVARLRRELRIGRQRLVGRQRVGHQRWCLRAYGGRGRCRRTRRNRRRGLRAWRRRLRAGRQRRRRLRPALRRRRAWGQRWRARRRALSRLRRTRGQRRRRTRLCRGLAARLRRRLRRDGGRRRVGIRARAEQRFVGWRRRFLVLLRGRAVAGGWPWRGRVSAVRAGQQRRHVRRHRQLRALGRTGHRFQAGPALPQVRARRGDALLPPQRVQRLQRARSGALLARRAAGPWRGTVGLSTLPAGRGGRLVDPGRVGD